jgi:hypothetical protein
MVARALGEPLPFTLGCLNLLWHRCWSLKTDTITAVGLTGIFGPEKLDARIALLVDAGFLEPAGAHFRVRGAERYLRIKEGNSRGGHASKRNLIPGGPRGGRAEVEPSPQADIEPRSSRETTSGSLGSSPNTEHRTPNTIEKRGREPDGPPPPPLELLPEVAKAKRTAKPPDPEAEFERFRAALTPDEREVFRAFGEAFGVDLGPDWGLRKFVATKLKAHHAAELVAAIRGAARDPWYRNKPTTLRALLSDASKVATLAKLGAA